MRPAAGAKVGGGAILRKQQFAQDDPQKVLVIATWQNMESWLRWKEEPGRKANESLMQQHLESPTEYEVYILGSYPPRKN